MWYICTFAYIWNLLHMETGVHIPIVKKSILSNNGYDIYSIIHNDQRVQSNNSVARSRKLSGLGLVELPPVSTFKHMACAWDVRTLSFQLSVKTVYHLLALSTSPFDSVPYQFLFWLCRRSPCSFIVTITFYSIICLFFVCGRIF